MHAVLGRGRGGAAERASMDVLQASLDETLRALLGAAVLFGSVVLLTEVAARAVPNGAVALVRLAGAGVPALTIVLWVQWWAGS
jgi:hypothetical protein